MSSPLVVAVSRGELVESRHLVSAAVTDLNGRVLETFGDTRTVVPTRSAAKPMQALALLHTGAADAFALSDEQIVMACASHSGEPSHLEAVDEMLATLGLDEGTLECGPSLPYGTEASREYLRRGGEPRRKVHNCSGKHAGFLALARHLGEVPDRYLARDGIVQKSVFATISELCGIHIDPADAAGDGCSAPVVCLPIESLARGCAALANDRSGQRIIGAAGRNPWYLAGTGRFDTRVTGALHGGGFCKFGAEGVVGAVCPERGVAIALKVHDGAKRAAEAAAFHLLVRHGALDADALQDLALPLIRDVNGTPVGAIRVELAGRRTSAR